MEDQNDSGDTKYGNWITIETDDSSEDVQYRIEEQQEVETMPLKCGHNKDSRKKITHKCYLCKVDTLMSSRRELYQHLDNVHWTEETYFCDQCSFSTEKVKIFNTHVSKHDESVRPFKCQICSLRFRNSRLVSNHQASAHRPDEYTCGICGRRYFQQWLLKQHEQTEHSAGSFGDAQRITNYIDESSQSSELPANPDIQIDTDEIYIIPDETPESPDDGAQGSTDSANDFSPSCRAIKTEEVTIISELPPEEAPNPSGKEVNDYVQSNNHCTNTIGRKITPKCYMCAEGAFYENQIALDVHIAANHHKGVYSCGQCSYSTRMVASFNGHLRRHDASTRPFKCHDCNLRFTTVQSLNKHKFLIHGIEYERKPRAKKQHSKAALPAETSVFGC